MISVDGVPTLTTREAMVLVDYFGYTLALTGPVQIREYWLEGVGMQYNVSRAIELVPPSPTYIARLQG